MHAWCASIGLSTRLHTPPADYVQVLLSSGGCCLSSAKSHVLLKSPSDAYQAAFVLCSNSDSRTYISDVPNSGVTLFSNSRALWKEAKTFDRCLFNPWLWPQPPVCCALAFVSSTVCVSTVAGPHYTALHCCIKHNTSHIPVHLQYN